MFKSSAISARLDRLFRAFSTKWKLESEIKLLRLVRSSIKLTVPGGIPLRRADGLAAMLISTCEGAVALSHVEGSLTPFVFAAAELVQAVTEALIGSPPRHDL